MGLQPPGYYSMFFPGGGIRTDRQLADGDDRFDWAQVNIAESFREPAGDSPLRSSGDRLVHGLRGRGDAWFVAACSAATNCRVVTTDPRQGTETWALWNRCSPMNCCFYITGDPFWADHCEEVAFNMYPAAVMPDFKSLRYPTAPNTVVDDENHAPGIDNTGPFLR